MIYFIQDQSTLLIKIGFTAGDPEDRRASLQTGCPSGLFLLLAIPGDKAAEHALHARFALARGLGEWFRPVPELLAYMLEQRAFQILAQHPASLTFLGYDDQSDPGVGPTYPLSCPSCGCENVHIQGAHRPTVGLGRDNWGHPDRFGIGFVCEAGCSFALNFGHHEGMTWLYTEDFGAVPDGEAVGQER